MYPLLSTVRELAERYGPDGVIAALIKHLQDNPPQHMPLLLAAHNNAIDGLNTVASQFKLDQDKFIEDMHPGALRRQAARY